MHRRTFLAAGAGVAAGLAPFASRPAVWPFAPAGITHQTGAAWFTNVRLRAHDGRGVRFYDDLLRGKIALINFVFTNCSDVCPGVTQNLADLQPLLGPRLGRDTFMYSISIDPENDTPQKLSAYAETFGAGSGWLFLTGKKADVELLRERLGFKDSDPAQDADPKEHIGNIRIGNEPLHRWIMAAGIARPEAILRSVKRAVPDWV